MSFDADILVENGLKEGLRLESILEAVQSRLERTRSEPTLAPPPTPATVEDTVIWMEEHREADHEQLVDLPTPHPVPKRPPRMHGLSRYDDLGVIGLGGMGEVRRVRDRRLGRVLAFKVIHAPALNRTSIVSRFLEEAQVTAQLQHPGIIPIHDLGTLPDGRLWFTMKEVSGQTFGEIIDEVHAESQTRWKQSPSGWTLRRLVDALRQVCEAVAYAHSRGVVHRDLKPDNIMVGSHGEVLVLDWGLAKVLDRLARAADQELGPVQTTRSREDAHHTQVGQVAGTPAYMPPEQALGLVDEIDARSDVYSLGALLYQVLSGRSPYQGRDAYAVLEQVRNHPPASLHGNTRALEAHRLRQAPDDLSATGPALPPSLVMACERAMARSPEDRFESAAGLAAELQAWLDGARRNDEARVVVARAKSKQPEATALRVRAAALLEDAAALLDGIEPWRPDDHKLPGWQKQDQAAALYRQAELAELERVHLLQGSLIHAPDLPEAHAALADHHRAEHAAAEAERRDTTRAETLLRHHVVALPEGHTERTDHLAYLRGHGALTLTTDPPGAEVLLHRYELQNRRLVPHFVRSLGTTPLHKVSIPRGSYLCLLKHPDRAVVRYPVSIGRGEHWHGVAPNGHEPNAIPLPKPTELGPDDCYIPAGWFQCGGDPDLTESLSARRFWVDGRVFRRFPVTNRQYLDFLDALVQTGRTEEALRHAPRERAGTAGEAGALIVAFDGTRFHLRPDADGDIWEPDVPVCMVNWHGARAYAAWEAHRTGQPWRLPGELAWEKAARGVDGRFYPWGDGFDPSWACGRLSHPGRILPQPVGAFPVDVSPYGVHDLAGSMCDWCLDAFLPEGPPTRSALATEASHRSEAVAGDTTYRVSRGGAWYNTPQVMRVSNRNGVDPAFRLNAIGFRLARSYP
ncbi:MAG: protein kinase [Deltaproteobacteria bacterium]|nr:protein kinase [Deltaproteobacteria bacterium]HCH67023.1 protein kinase [Deltaproteobacteria bacterium]